MKNLRYLVFGVVLVSFMMTSCKKETTPVNEAQTLVEFLESPDSPLMKDYVSTDMPAIIGATEVKTLNEVGKVYIVDIRDAADFAIGHIENAHNVATTDIFTHLEGVDLTPYDKIAILCYTGQTAAWTTCLLRISGYANVYSMKWGMASWNADFAASWCTKVGNTYATQFTADATAKGAAGELPELMTGKETGQEILDTRVAAVLTEGFGAAKISATEVFGALDNYYIVNYWPEAHYTDPGHIPGAMQYTPKEAMQLAKDLKTLPTNKTIVVYCYTGQNSANLTSYLRVLGYDAKSLLYGTNGMMYDTMVAKGLTNFSDTQVMGYVYVK